MSEPRQLELDRNLLEDLGYWARARPRTLLRIFELMEAVARDAFVGVGQPEPLKHRGPDIWSRRIDQEHRLIYAVFADRIVFLAGRGQYTR